MGVQGRVQRPALQEQRTEVRYRLRVELIHAQAKIVRETIVSIGDVGRVIGEFPFGAYGSRENKCGVRLPMKQG